MIFSTIATFDVVAVSPPDQTIEVPASNTYQAHIEANVATQFQFRQRTQLMFQANVGLDINMDCDALNIGDKDFVLEVEAEQDLEMNMTCTHEEAELGLLLGNTYQYRNRNTYQYQEGFICALHANGTFLQARLRIRATNQNQLGTWAYYNEANAEWIPVPTTVEDGYLTATVDHFSTWTILMPDYTALIVGISIGVSAAVIVAIVIFYYKRRK
jgi:hypothetical protein